jgi:O-methyltransferase involved in polyketide biosynthesis
MPGADDRPGGDLSVTALYTCQTWAWGHLPGAELLATPDSRRVFGATNLFLGLARLLRPRLPSLRHSLVLRHLILDRLLAEAASPQVLELAAGLSRRGVTVSSDPAIGYVEVDLPQMVAHKRALLGRTEAGRAALRRPNLVLVEGDALAPGWEDLVDHARPVTVVAEGLLVYLDAEARRSLWRRAATLLKATGGVLLFDLVPGAEEPRPGPLGRALGWLMRRFTGGRGFVRAGETRAELVADLAACGLSDVTLVEPASAPAGWALPFARKRTQTVVFRCAP